MNPATPTKSYYPALDGLRGIAILLVICCHNLNFLPHFKFGWIGVDLFFVLSGFLITDILLKARDKKNFLQNFYIRRILKIFPVYYGILLLFFAIAPALPKIATEYNYYYRNQAMLWLHLQNWLSILDTRFAGSLMLNHFWSLSVEEQFYLFWPILVLLIKNVRLLSQVTVLILVICILSRFLSWFYLGDRDTIFIFQYMTRLDGLCIGSLIAIWRYSSYDQTKKKIFILALAICGSYTVLFILTKTFFLSLPHFTFLGYTVIALIFGIIVFYSVEKRNGLSRILLENKVLRYIGRISYGLYIYHWPILALFKIYLLESLVNYGFNSYNSYAIVSVVALFAAFFVSVISYHFFEKKLLDLKDVITADGFFERAWKKLSLFFRPISQK